MLLVTILAILLVSSRPPRLQSTKVSIITAVSNVQLDSHLFQQDLRVDGKVPLQQDDRSI